MFDLFEERGGGGQSGLYLAEGSGMWEHSAFFSPGFVFIVLTQEAHSGGASLMLSEKR